MLDTFRVASAHVRMQPRRNAGTGGGGSAGPGPAGANSWQGRSTPSPFTHTVPAHIQIRRLLSVECARTHQDTGSSLQLICLSSELWKLWIGP
jgi:hypothetical protein